MHWVYDEYIYISFKFLLKSSISNAPNTYSYNHKVGLISHFVTF